MNVRLARWLDAKCAGRNTHMFYPEVKGQDGPALVLCDECAIREPCLKYALEHEDHGIWGGTTERERRRIRRHRRKVAS